MFIAQDASQQEAAREVAALQREQQIPDENATRE